MPVVSNNLWRDGKKKNTKKNKLKNNNIIKLT